FLVLLGRADDFFLFVYNADFFIDGSPPFTGPTGLGFGNDFFVGGEGVADTRIGSKVDRGGVVRKGRGRRLLGRRLGYGLVQVHTPFPGLRDQAQSRRPFTLAGRRAAEVDFRRPFHHDVITEQLHGLGLGGFPRLGLTFRRQRGRRGVLVHGLGYFGDFVLCGRRNLLFGQPLGPPFLGLRRGR